MGVHFIIGGSGSGKTTHILKQIIKKSVSDPSGHYLIIVPEQFTMQTQREVVNLHPSHSVINIEILSFLRLSARVFSELGTRHDDVIGDTGKNLILRRVFSEKKDSLKVLRSGIDKAGYVSEIRSFLSELSQYGIDTEGLLKIRDADGFTDRFKGKIDDIDKIYSGFQEFIQGKYITTEDLLHRLSIVISKSGLVKGQTIVLDGFTGFTPVQIELLSEIIRIAGDVYITLTMDPEKYNEDFDEEDLFFTGKKTIRQLRSLAEKAGKSIDFYKMTSGIRFANSEELSFLERNILRDKYGKKANDSGDIRLISLKNMNSETDFIASEIRELTRKGYSRYKDIAVVTSSVDSYEYRIRESFRKYDIPFFTDQTIKAGHNPLFSFVKTALRLESRNYRAKDMQDFLKCGIPILSEDEMDDLDRYIDNVNLRGFSSYKRKFRRHSKTYPKGRLEALEPAREKLMSLLSPFHEALSSASTVRDITIALYSLLLRADVPVYLKNHAETLKDDSIKKEYESVYGVFIELLDTVVRLLGDEETNIDDYSNIIASGFDTLKIGTIPAKTDSVIFGDLERTRLSNIKVLFLCGAYDGMIPKNETRGGILSEMEREKLKEMGFELALTGRERAFRQRYYLYLCLTKSSEKLYVISPEMDNEGKSTRRSYIYDEIMKLFPDKRVERILSFREEGIVNRMTEDDAIVSLLADRRSGKLDDDGKKLLARILKLLYQKDRERIENIISLESFRKHPDVLMDKENREKIMNSLKGSISMFEAYAACPFSFYLKYLIKACEWEESTVDSISMGDFYHKALEEYSINMDRESKGAWDRVDQKRAKEILEKAMEGVEESDEFSRFSEEARESFRIEEIKDTLRLAVPIITKNINEGKFKPEGFEVKLPQDGQKLSSLRYDLEDGSEIDFHGKVDRIDIYESEDKKLFVKISDYKSGNKDLNATEAFGGIDIQMLVYMDAALEYESLKYNKETHPGAVYYIQITDDAVKNDKGLAESVLKKGILNSSIGSEIKAGEILSEEEWKALKEKIRNLIKEEGSKIHKGMIEAHPYKNKDKNGCKYCSFHRICHFDPAIAGFDYRKLESYSNFKGESK